MKKKRFERRQYNSHGTEIKRVASIEIVSKQKTRRVIGADFSPATKARDLEQLLTEIESECREHPRRGKPDSWCVMVDKTIKKIRIGSDPRFTAFYSLGVYVERMRGEIRPIAGGRATAKYDDERQEVIAREVDRLLRQDMQLSSALKHLAKRYGCSTRTIRRYHKKYFSK